MNELLLYIELTANFRKVFLYQLHKFTLDTNLFRHLAFGAQQVFMIKVPYVQQRVTTHSEFTFYQKLLLSTAFHLQCVSIDKLLHNFKLFSLLPNVNNSLKT